MLSCFLDSVCLNADVGTNCNKRADTVLIERPFRDPPISDIATKKKTECSNSPELPRLLFRVGQLDQGVQDLLDDPGSLIFMICKDLSYQSGEQFKQAL